MATVNPTKAKKFECVCFILRALGSIHDVPVLWGRNVTV